MKLSLFFQKKENRNGIDSYIMKLYLKLSQLDNIQILNLRPNSCLTILPKKIINMILFFTIPFKIYSNRIDIFFSHNHRLPLFISNKCLYVVTIHDLTFKRHPKTMSKLNYLADSFFIPYSIEKSKVIISVSQSTTDEIINFYPQHSHKIRTIHLSGFFNTHKQSNHQEENKKYSKSNYLLFVGTIEPRKNIIRLIHAFDMLPEEISSKYKLIITGNQGWGNIKLNSEIKKLSSYKSIVLTGYVDDDILKKLYINAYCLVMPSLYEGFGLPIIEAHSFGVPVITSNTSSMPEIAGQGAIYVNPFDIKNISRAMELIIKNKLLRENLSDKATLNSLRFSWDKTCSDIVNVFNEIMNQK